MGKIITGAQLITKERKRQIKIEGHSAQCDDHQFNKELARAANCYLEFEINSFPKPNAITTLWPWELKSFKPKSTIRNLVRAGALIAAEIDRLQRRSK